MYVSTLTFALSTFVVVVKVTSFTSAVFNVVVVLVSAATVPSADVDELLAPPLLPPPLLPPELLPVAGGSMRVKLNVLLLVCPALSTAAQVNVGDVYESDVKVAVQLLVPVH